MRERIKILRKTLKLTQKAFGAQLNLSENFVALLETGARNASDRTVADICREFKVSETWLRTGEGPMLQPETTFSLDALARERGATDLELAILKAYFSFSDETRQEIREKLGEILSGLYSGSETVRIADPPNVHDWTPDEMAAEARRQAEAEEADRKGGGAGSSTSGPGNCGTA